MQPSTKKGYMPQSMQRLKRKIETSRACNTQRDKDPAYALPVPFEVGLKLTNRCDLRCAHCFQWNEDGYHQHMASPALVKDGDLDIAIVKEVLEFTRPTQAMLYLWGGEPLLYGKWDELVQLLMADTRETVICTNGLTLLRRMEGICAISQQLTILVSIEGLEDEHDALRGKNSFSRTIRGLDALCAKRDAGDYKGIISVAAVLSDHNIDRLFEFCSYFEDKGIDTLYLNFPWYIPEDVAFGMDEYFRANFSWMGTDKSFRNSWHSFDFHISEGKIGPLLAQMQRLKEKDWNIRIRFQPDLKDGELVDFIRGGIKPGQRKTRCLGISNRLDILPDGVVTPCKKFIEFQTGDLKRSTLAEIWNGPAFHKFRSIHNNTLMAICSKCEILYMNGI